MSATVTLLRPYGDSASLRRLADARRCEAVDLLRAGRYTQAKRRMADAVAISRHAQLAADWERDVQGAVMAAGDILRRAGR